MKRNICFAVLLCLTIAQPACSLPRTYSADRIDARVIDAETEQPLEGVIVVAHWELRSTGYNPGGSVPVGQMMTMEAITDKEGRFHFPAWGPLIAWKGQMHDDDPQLIFFKSGYTRLILSNEDKFTLASVLRSHRTSDWNGKTIEIKPFKGEMKRYVGLLHNLNAKLEQIISWNPKECNWKKLPKAIVTMDRERKLLEQKGADPQTLDSVYLHITYNDDWYTRNGSHDCGSPKEFFRKYKP